MTGLRVLHLIPYMHPSAGGPPVVVDRWAVELQRLGCEVTVLSTDAYSDGELDWLDEYRQRYPITVCSKLGPKGFGYSTSLKSIFRKLLPQQDIVHVHNLWGYTNQLAGRICPRAGVPFVVSSHGMLDPNSMSRKRWKKSLYAAACEWPVLRRATAMIYTHAEEERLARETCHGLPTGHVVPLGTEEPPSADRGALREKFFDQYPDLRSRRLVVFLGRLHSKKGLDLLLPAMKSVSEQFADVTLVLAGPGEADYVESLRRQVESLGTGDSTVLTGALHGEMKWMALAAAELFVLPSYQENFAIAVAEAMRIGTPVVCSRRVNIWSDIVSAGAAVDCELTTVSVADRILELLADKQRRRRIGEHASEFAETHYSWPNSARALKAAYFQALNVSA